MWKKMIISFFAVVKTFQTATSFESTECGLGPRGENSSKPEHDVASIEPDGFITEYGIQVMEQRVATFFLP
jgi:hypothetical protein